MRKTLISFLFIVILLGGCILSNINDSETKKNSTEHLSDINDNNMMPELAHQGSSIESDLSEASDKSTKRPLDEITTKIEITPLDVTNSLQENNINPYHPIVVMHKNYKGVFQNTIIGGFKDDKWYSITDFNPPTIYTELRNFSSDLATGSEEYKIYSENDYITSLEGKKPILSHADSCDTYTLDPLFNDLESEEGCLIGINCDWDPLPKISKRIDQEREVIDLDNDGENEIIYTHEVQDSKNATKDITMSVLKNGNTIKNLHFLAGNEDRYNRFFMDLNNDGILEIVIVTFGRWEFFAIYQMNNNEINQIFGFYMGD